MIGARATVATGMYLTGQVLISARMFERLTKPLPLRVRVRPVFILPVGRRCELS
jgi:hypothetical protein